MTLSDARLAVDVGQSHLSLFVQLPIEGHGIFKVIFVAAVVEETEANGIDYFNVYYRWVSRILKPFLSRL